MPVRSQVEEYQLPSHLKPVLEPAVSQEQTQVRMPSSDIYVLEGLRSVRTR